MVVKIRMKSGEEVRIDRVYDVTHFYGAMIEEGIEIATNDPKHGYSEDIRYRWRDIDTVTLEPLSKRRSIT